MMLLMVMMTKTTFENYLTVGSKFVYSEKSICGRVVYVDFSFNSEPKDMVMHYYDNTVVLVWQCFSVIFH